MLYVIEDEPCIDDLASLAEEADAHGHRMVSRLVQEWSLGENRFDGPGERLFASRVKGRVVGVCGLNRDPLVELGSWCGIGEIGRVRRLYVATHMRRKGIASALLGAVIQQARQRFIRLRVRTHNSAAAAFYTSQGFSGVPGDPYCTHEMLIGAPAPQSA